MRRSPTVTQLLGRRLRALRELRGLTQEQLGERAGVSGKFIGQCERGVGNPSISVVARLAQSLHVELWELVRFEESRAAGAPARAATAFAAAERMSEYLSGRPAGEVERALRILEAALDDPPGGRDG
jgi:transcriptional regulator with XRE-family HTH domain